MAGGSAGPSTAAGPESADPTRFHGSRGATNPALYFELAHPLRRPPALKHCYAHRWPAHRRGAEQSAFGGEPCVLVLWQAGVTRAVSWEERRQCTVLHRTSRDTDLALLPGKICSVTMLSPGLQYDQPSRGFSVAGLPLRYAR